MLFSFVLAALLVAMPLVAQEDEEGDDLFYVARGQSVWAIDLDTQIGRPVFTLTGEVNPNTLSENEQRFRERYRAMEGVIDAGIFEYPGLDQTIREMWGDPPDHLVLLVENQQCSQATTWRMCVGYYTLHTLNKDERPAFSDPLFTLDYHDLPPTPEWQCDPDTSQIVTDVVPNPHYSAAILLLHGSSACYNQLSRAILVNYRPELPYSQEIPNAHDFAWSPNGETLAFVSAAHCFEGAVCQPSIGLLRDLQLLNGVYPAVVLNSYATLSEIAWVDDHTLHYMQKTCSAYSDTACYSEEVTQEIP